MGISYSKLWKLLIDCNMTKTDLKNKIGLNSVTIASMGKNQHVSMRAIEKICKGLDCNFGDIIDYVKDSNENGESNND